MVAIDTSAFGAPDIAALQARLERGAQTRSGLVNLSTVTPERVSWAWHGRLPLGKLVVLDGDPSVGKSTLTCDLAARITTGVPWPDGSPGSAPAGVLLLSAEDGLADTIAPRLAAAGADATRVHALVTVTLASAEGEPLLSTPSLPRDLPRIEEIVVEHGVRLVVVDVLMAYLNGKVDAHRDQDVRGVLHQLAAMAERTGCCVILLRHLNKAGGGSPLYRGGGSIGIVGAARAAFLVARDPEDTERRIFAVTKLNIGAEPPSLAYRLVDAPEHGCARIQWEDGPTEHTAAGLLALPSTEEERDERDEVTGWLVDHLASQGGQAVAGSILKAARGAGMAERTVQRARKRAGVTSRKDGTGGGWLWSLETQGATEEPEGAEDASSQSAAPSAPSVAPSQDDPTPPARRLAVVDSATTDHAAIGAALFARHTTTTGSAS